MDTLVCSKCKSELPVSDFYRNKARKNGYSDYCKKCFNGINKASYEKHLDARLAKARETNHKPGKAEQRKEVTRKWYAEHGREWHQGWKERNRESVRSSTRKWQKANRVYVQQAVNRYRLRLKGVGGSHTAEQWLSLCKKYGDRCIACGEQKPLTRDHVIPVILGGTDDISNIQPLCRACNTRKGAKSTDYRY